MAIIKHPNGEKIGDIPDRCAQRFISAGIVTFIDRDGDMAMFAISPRGHLFAMIKSALENGDLTNEITADEAYLKLGQIFDMFEAEIKGNVGRVYNA